MGRCYEFGVSVEDGCEHAMSVVADGGACECTVCQAQCPGRFAGCAQVVSQPGYIPALAPAWARSGRDAAAPVSELSPPRSGGRPAVGEPEAGDRRPVGDVEAELATIRELVEKLLERPEGDALHHVRGSLEERDAELTSMFDQFMAAHGQLTTEVKDTGAAQAQLAELLGRIEVRLGTLEELLSGRSGMLDWLRRMG